MLFIVIFNLLFGSFHQILRAFLRRRDFFVLTFLNIFFYLKIRRNIVSKKTILIILCKKLFYAYFVMKNNILNHFANIATKFDFTVHFIYLFGNGTQCYNSNKFSNNDTNGTNKKNEILSSLIVDNGMPKQMKLFFKMFASVFVD